MPEVQTVPALPWPTGDGGGIIKLSRRVTEQDLIDGILKITLDNAGREYNASIVRYQDNTLRVVADNDVFTIDPIPQTSDTLTLTRIAGEAAQAYSLVSVEFIHLEQGIYVLTGDDEYVFRVIDAKTIVPLYREITQENQGKWWVRASYGAYSYKYSAHPLSDEDSEDLISKLSFYGITTCNAEGELKETLTSDEVTVLP